MRLALTDEQEALRQKLRAYFEDITTDEIDEEMAEGEMGGPKALVAVRKMGEDKVLGLGWPTEYGGGGLGAVEQFIYYDEAQRAGAPLPMLSLNSVAPTIMAFGTDEQKQFFLPKILAGEIQFAIGYTEPASGTDLASLKTKAERDGDEWVINGQKIFTSIAEHADYVWLAVRTDPDAPKHRGISIIIVPTDAPGYSRTPINIMGDAKTNATYYDNVRVPVTNLVGEVNRGWDLIVNQLNYERVALAPPGWVDRQYTGVRRWAQNTKLGDGRRVIDQEWVQLNLAKVHAKLDVLRLINWKVAWSAGKGKLNPADASATKVYGTELFCEAYGLLLEILGPAGALKRHSPEAALRGSLERAYQGTLILTFGGGTNEVQRDLVAIFGLGMPRAIST
ncbi:MAG: 3-oxocholest-4-en-26-oyl-CoA dehydrogenase alpha subunit [Actinomycetota bacterium]|nr:3-oxocholest-4-en-26-oyl-CoA dehydrogenase alpha subunit [Actinomycetota bacterium]